MAGEPRASPPQGEGWKLTDAGATALDGGDIPWNCSGGVLSSNPIGASGMLRFLEAAMQVRGQAGEHQVEDVRARARPRLRRRLAVLRHVGARHRQALSAARRCRGPGRRAPAGYTVAAGRVETEVRPMKVVVDYDVCASNAVCMGIVPEVFEVRDDGYLYVLEREPPPELMDKVRMAANNCPTGAITLVEDE